MHPIERLRYVARASGAEHGLLVRETAGALAALGPDPAGLLTACRRILQRHPQSGPLWWLATRVLTADDPMREAWRCADEVDADRTAVELAYALPDEATVCVVGWPEQIGEALPRRGDVEVLVVDALGEGAGLVRRLRYAEVDAIEVPMSGVASAAAAADVVLVEASALGDASDRAAALAVAGSRAAAAVACHAGVPVWLVAGVGRPLPGKLFGAVLARVEDDAPWDDDDEWLPLDLVEQVAGPGGVGPVDAALARGAAAPLAPELLRSDAGWG